MVMGLLADRFPAELHAFRSYETTLTMDPESPRKTVNNDKKEPPEPPYFKPPPPHGM